jgi:VIT1/CCC1 family predicted Fe2+/Mn2+ transporter
MSSSTFGRSRRADRHNQKKKAMPPATDLTEERRILDPIDRNSEILFGLFMVLSFTGTLSVTSAGRDDVRTMLVAAIACNAAWGFVDGMMYVLRNLVERGRQALIVRSVRAADRPEDAHRLIAHALGPSAAALGAGEFERVRQWVVAQPAPDTHRARLTRRDLLGAAGIFVLVFASTFPVVLPYLFITELQTAHRLSGAIAIALLFLCGHRWGHYAGLKPWRTGLVMVLMGALIMAVIIALGG